MGHIKSLFPAAKNISHYISLAINNVNLSVLPKVFCCNRLIAEYHKLQTPQNIVS